MFHYRLILTDNRLRMLLALIAAILVHMGFMRFPLVHRPVMIPGVSLPRSVSVVLGQNRRMEATVLHQQEQHVSEQQEETVRINRLSEPFNSSPAPAINAKPDRKVPAPSVIPRKAYDEAGMIPITDLPAINRIEQPIQRSSSDDAAQSSAKADKAAVMQEQEHAPVTPGEREGEGGTKAGTVQIAYPRYEVNKPPVYPGLARKRGQEGRVVLQALVNAEGVVDDLEVETSSGVGLLDHAALAAVRQWQFEPGRQGKKKVSMRVKVPIVFKLKR